MSRRGSRTRTGSRRPLLYVVGAVVAVTAAVLLVVGLSRQDDAPARALPPAPAPVEGGAANSSGAQEGDAAQGENGAAQGEAGGGAQQVQALRSSPPERITIPSLKVSSTLERLGRDAGGAMETPRDPDKAGWYTPGPAPGATGPSVVAGHVTWNGERSVFFRLAELKAGDKVEVTRRDGRTAEFTVDRIEQYSKDRFPTLSVYGNVDHAALRLITCGGKFSADDHRYADNIVVYASMTGSHT
ncbi:class F sortase [Streptomyces sp. NPDC048639]|uniref:class F sortase n=1 Tax=Streptomyces sp. NPDC048639 TaxID=3365581 RepID=UPI00371AE1FA